MFMRYSQVQPSVFCAATIAAGLAVNAHAITVDGTLDGAYGSALATQTINSGYGDSTVGDGSSAGGSELDAAYGLIQGGNLYLFVAGNIELNYNHINVFIADGRSGQNTLSVPSGSLSAMNGSVFSPGFSATYALDFNGGSGANGTLYTDQYNLVGTPSTSFVGGVALSGGIGNGNFSGIQIGLNDVNAAGVNGNSGTAANGAAANAVGTGLELAIPLSQLGNPSGSIQVLIDINGNGNTYLSNQLLPGLPAGTGNLGNGGVLNLGSTPGEFFTVPAPAPEPSTWALYALSGAATLFGLRRRK